MGTVRTKGYDDEVREGRYPAFNNEVVFSPAFEVGMEYETKNEFKKAIQSHAIQTKRSLRFEKNDKTRVYARCRGDGCDWGVNLIKRVNESTFRIRNYKLAHKCAPGDEDVCDGDGFDETRISDVPFEVGMVFETKNEFKKAIQSHAIQTKRSLHLEKNDKTRVYARCSGDGCDWGINLIKRVYESTFQIKSYKPAHKCAPTFTVSNLKSNWLGERYVSAFQNDSKINVEGWRHDIMRELNVNVSKQQAYRAKRKALEIIEGFPNEHYSKLRDYAQKLRRKFTHQYLSFKKSSSSCTQVAGGVKNVQVEEEPEEPVHVSKRQKLKVSRDKSASTSGVIHANATNQEEHFTVSGPPTKGKIGARPPKLSRDKSASTSEVIHANPTNQEEDFIVSGSLTRAKNRGRPPKASRDKSASTSGVIHTNATNQEENFIVSGSLTRAKTRGRPPMRGKTKGRPPNVSQDKSASTSGVIHANATNQEEDFIVSGPPTRAKTRGRPPRVTRDKSASTSGVIHANVTNQEEDFIVSGPPTSGKTRGRPPKVSRDKFASTSGFIHANATNQGEDFILNIDNNSIRHPKPSLGLIDEDEDDEFEALLILASSATNAS